MNFTTIAETEIEFWFSNGDSELTPAHIEEIKSDLLLDVTKGYLKINDETVGGWRTTESYLSNNSGMFCQHGGDTDRCIVCNPKTGDPYEW